MPFLKFQAYRRPRFDPHHTKIWKKKITSIPPDVVPRKMRPAPNIRHILAHFIRVRPLKLAQLRAPFDFEENLLSRR